MDNDILQKHQNIGLLYEKEKTLLESSKLISHLISIYSPDTTLLEVLRKINKETDEIYYEINEAICTSNVSQ